MDKNALQEAQELLTENAAGDRGHKERWEACMQKLSPQGRAIFEELKQKPQALNVRGLQLTKTSGIMLLTGLGCALASPGKLMATGILLITGWTLLHESENWEKQDARLKKSLEELQKK